MRRRGMPEVHSSHPNVTPLIDVVMCLIVFFMLVAKIGVSTGAEASIAIPASAIGQELKILDSMGNKQLLEVLRHLRFGRDGKPGGAGPNTDNDEFKIIIRGDKN